MKVWVFSFWLGVTLVAYTYLLYPVILFGLSALRPRRGNRPDGGALPRVTVVVPVFNEATAIGDKLRNLAATEYPPGQLQVLIGSDGSTDATNEVVSAYEKRADIRFFAFPHRRGKAAVLNDLVPRADGDVIVFSDANTSYDPAAVSRLASHFSDPTVGAVCGELILTSDERTAGGRGEGLYWRYENTLKRLESNISTTIGSVGPVYAIRKSLFRRLPTATAVMDDFLIPLAVLRDGYRIVYEPTAVAYERPSNSVRGEFQRKARIGAANFQVLPAVLPLLTPSYGFAAFALWSHKVLRWIAPLLLVVTFASSALLAVGSAFFRAALLLQMAFLVAALIGSELDRRRRRSGIFGLAYYFLATNAALLVGFGRYVSGRQRPTWDVIR